MRQGKSNLEELAKTIIAEAEAKEDIICDTPAITLSENGTIKIEDRELVIGEHFHGQMAAHLNIPRRYYDRLWWFHRDLLVNDVNALLTREPKRRMVRTLGGSARAFLSDKYRILDNEQVLESVLPILTSGDVQLASMEVTESRLYIKATFPECRGEVTPGDVVESGVMLTNSEVGLGALAVTPFVNRLVCTNGMVVNEAESKFGIKKMHLGGRIQQEGVFLRDDTLEASDKAFFMQVRDVVGALGSRDSFDKILNTFREAAGQDIEGDPVRGIEILQKRTGLRDGEKASVIRHLIEGGDLSKWGVANAVTRTAVDVESYDRATDLEALGGKIVTMPEGSWREIATAQ